MEKRAQNDRKLKGTAGKTSSKNQNKASGTGQRALYTSGTRTINAVSNGTGRPASVRKKPPLNKNSDVITYRGLRIKNSNTKVGTTNTVPRQKQVSTSNKNIATQNNGSSSKSNYGIISLYISIFLVLFILFCCILPLKQISYEVPVIYQDTEIYTEQVPYIETVFYTEQEPYTTSEPYIVREPYITYQPQPGQPRPPYPPPPTTDNTTIPLPPPPPPPIPQYREVIHYSTVTKYQNVVRYQEVEKSRGEIRYKTVQKQRTVNKIKQETRYKMVPLLYSLMGY